MGYSLRSFSLLIIAVTLLAAGCDNPSSPPVTEPEPLLLPIPEFGSEVLPAGGLAASKLPSMKDGLTLPAYGLLRDYFDAHPQNPYVAVVGIWNPKKKRYDYKALPLTFSEEIQKQAQGIRAYYRYRVEVKGQGVYRNLAAVIPATSQAQIFMNQWLRIKHSSRAAPEGAKKTRSSKESTTHRQFGGDGLDCDYEQLPNGDWIAYNCEEVVVEGPLGPEDDDDSPWPGPPPPPPGPPSPPFPEHHPPGGGGSGGSPDDNSNPDCNNITGGAHSLVPIEDQDPSNPQPLPSNPHNPSNPSNPTTPSCEEEDASFMGTIGIDTKELDKFPKLKCTVDRVLDTSNMQNLIAKFGMANTNYDLIFSGSSKLEDKDGDEFLGGLNVVERANANDQFILLVNNNMAQGRSSVEVGITYLHEAMHAEMRRYLLDNAQTSTLPNFPGSITEDWENYVATRNSREDAEHHAMGYTDYIDFIAQAASDFDNGRMPFNYYQGLAWVGIYDKDNEGWKNASEAYKSEIRKGHKNAKEELKGRNNDMCN